MHQPPATVAHALPEPTACTFPTNEADALANTANNSYMIKSCNSTHC